MVLSAISFGHYLLRFAGQLGHRSKRDPSHPRLSADQPPRLHGFIGHGRIGAKRHFAKYTAEADSFLGFRADFPAFSTLN